MFETSKRGGGRGKATSDGRRGELPEALTYDEVDRLLDQCETLEDLAFVLLGIFGGLRVAEICNVRGRDVDVVNDAVFVEDGKGDKDRWAPVTGVTAQVLRILGAGGDGEDRLFTRSARTYERRIKAMAAAAGIPRAVTPHTLRHTCATLQLDMGVDPLTVKDNLGHENLRTTMLYTHLSPRTRSRKYKDAMRTVL